MPSQIIDLSSKADEYVVSSASTVTYDRNTKTFSREAVVFLIEPTDGPRCTESTKSHVLMSIRWGLEEAAYLRETVLPSMTTDDEKDGWSKCVTALCRSHPGAMISPTGDLVILPTLQSFTFRHSSLDKSGFDILVSEGLEERVAFTSTQQGVMDQKEKALTHSRAKMMTTKEFQSRAVQNILPDYPQEWCWYKESCEKSQTFDLAVTALSSAVLQAIMDEEKRNG
jgi:hypothetical protein